MSSPESLLPGSADLIVRSRPPAERRWGTMQANRAPVSLYLVGRTQFAASPRLAEREQLINVLDVSPPLFVGSPERKISALPRSLLRPTVRGRLGA